MPATWILSDLHEEIARPASARLVPPPAFDLLVVAGDLHEGDLRAGIEAVARLADGRPAIAVLGNHDLYGLPIVRAAEVAAAIGRRLGVHVLEGQSVEVAGLRVCGGTLWDDVGPRPGAEPRMDLTRVLSGAEPAFSAPPQSAPYGEPVDVEEGGRARPATNGDIAAARSRLLGLVAAADPDLVVTHYPPDARCLARAPNAAAWIHGHVHVHDRSIRGGTEVIVNARQAHAFAERMVVAIEPRPRPSRDAPEPDGVAAPRFGR